MNQNRVMVIHSNPIYDAGWVPFPPIGTLGMVISELDNYSEYDVVFDGYPCPTPPDKSWVTHKSMIVFLEDDKDRAEITQDNRVTVSVG